MSPGGAWWVACVVAEAVALAGAVRRPRSRPLVTLLAFALASDVAVRAGAVLVLAGAPRPLAGWPLAWWRVETALVTGWPAALAVVAWWVFAGPQKPNAPDSSEAKTHGLTVLAAVRGRGAARCGRSTERTIAQAVLSSWASLQVGLAVAPLTRPRLAGILLAWHVAGVVVGAAPIALRWGKGARSVEHHVVGLLVAVLLAVVCCGPFVGDVWADWATTATPAWAIGFGLAAGLLWRRR